MSKGRRQQQVGNHECMLVEARKRLRDMDRIDGQPFVAIPVDMQIDTAATAIETGLQIGDTGCIYDGLLMLRDALAVMPRTKGRTP